MRRLLLPLLVLLATAAAAGPASSADAGTQKRVHRRHAKQTRVTCKHRTVRSANGRRHRVRVCRGVHRRPARTTATAPTSTTVAPATATALTGSAPGGPAGQVRDCANTERAKIGLPALADDPALDRAAVAHATDMRDRGYFSHVTPDGVTPWDRIAAALHGEQPFVWMGENIAMGFADVPSTCTGWMNSPGHRANILDPHFTMIGTAWVDGYAVQDFGSRSS